MAVYTKIRSSALSGSIPGSGEAAAAAGGLGLTDLDSILDHVASSVKRIHGAATFSEAAAGEFSQNITPVTDAAYDLGTSSKEWKDLYIDGVAYVDSLQADQLGAALDANSQAITNINVDSGAIDGTIIGANSVAAGSFAAVVGTTATFSSTLTANADVDLGNATSDTVTVTGRFDSDLVPSTDGARDLGASALEWKDLYIDGVAYIDDAQIGQLSAALDANSQAITNVDINSGAIDGTSVGSASASTGAFTTLGATGVASLSGDVDLTATGGNNADPDLSVAGYAKFAGAVEMDGVVDIDGSLDLDGSAADVSTSGQIALHSAQAAATAVVIEATDASGGVDINAPAGVDISAALAVGGNLTVAGNLDVNGTTTTVDTANMTIEDRIIGLGVSGSGGPYSNLDTGIVFGYGASFDKQQGLFLTGGSTFHLGKSITSPASASMAIISAADYADLTVGEVHFESATNKLRIAGSDLVMDSGGDILLDPAGLQVFVDGDVVPNSDGARDLGSSAKEWKDLYIDGIAYIDELRADALGANLDCANYNMTNVDIDSGAIDGAVIGANVAAGGAFTSLSATLITDLDGDVNLGNATSDTITATGRFDSDLTPSTDNARDLGGPALRYAEGHIVIAHLDQLGQALDCDSNAMTNVNIDTGAIELVALDIDGGTNMTDPLADADLIIIDDGADGTNKKATMNLVADYVFGEVQKAVLVPGPVVAGGDVAVGFNIYKATYASGNQKLREVYVNGQLAVEDTNATQGNGNKDFYKGTGQTNLRFEFPLLDGDVVTVILRGTIAVG